MRLPPGYRRGLKKDTPSRVADRCEPVTEAIDLIPRDYWDDLAASQWHESKDEWVRFILDQDGVGSCAAESKDGATQAIACRQGEPMVYPNPWATYHFTSGGVDRGSVIGDNLEFARDDGCIPEEIWPRSKGWKARPSPRALEIAGFFRLREFYHVRNVDEFVSALLQGYIVHAGYDGHAVYFTRYLGKGRLRFPNSWGNWGDNGFGTLATSKIYFGYGAYAYRVVRPYSKPGGEIGRYDDAGKWEKCPWQPAMDQRRLGHAVATYISQLHAHKRKKGRTFSPTQAADAYARACVVAGAV